jgi:ubiquinone/menaquinone biosynthesis C-methylase UbiE
MTPEMLERARLAASRLGVRNVEFRQGYLESLPVEAANVDVVISNCVINLSPDKPQVFREIFRTLKPGGRVAVSDIVTNGPLPEALKKDMEAWGACVAGALDVSEYTTGLSEAGFTDVEVQPKGDASELIEAAGLKGKIFSAAITARKPA